MVGNCYGTSRTLSAPLDFCTWLLADIKTFINQQSSTCIILNLDVNVQYITSNESTLAACLRPLRLRESTSAPPYPTCIVSQPPRSGFCAHIMCLRSRQSFQRWILALDVHGKPPMDRLIIKLLLYSIEQEVNVRGSPSQHACEEAGRDSSQQFLCHNIKFAGNEVSYRSSVHTCKHSNFNKPASFSLGSLGQSPIGTLSIRSWISTYPASCSCVRH